MTDIWQLIIHSNIINFLLVLALIIFLIIKLNFKDKIEEKRNEIKSYVDAAKNEKLSAEENLEKIKGKIIKLPALIERIEKSANHNIENIEERIKQETEDQKEVIKSNSARLLKLETKKFNQKLIGILSEECVEIARKNALKLLNGNRELHDFYIDKAIEEIDRINL